MRQTMEQRVARGIALLNEHAGRGWRRKVRLGRLDLGSGDNCVLGQIFEGRGTDTGYDYALYRHPGFRSVLRSGQRAATYGFVNYDIDAESETVEALTEEWRKQLRQVPR